MLRFCKSPGTDRGLCDAPYNKNKHILVHEDLRGEERLEVLIHEMLHAGVWDLAEEAVGETARDIARVLTKLGYVNIHELREDGLDE